MRAPHLDDGDVVLYQGDVLDVLRELPAESVDCCLTSPPYYGLRDYGVDGQIGLEPTPAEFVARLVAVFREVRRVLAPHGTCWVNLGDSYAGSSATGRNDEDRDTPGGRGGSFNGGPRAPFDRGGKPKDLLGIPWRVALALQDDGWWLRSDVVWSKPNPMPESVTDRPTRSHEYVFMLSKSARYYFDQEAGREEGIAIANRGGSLARNGDDPYVSGEAHRGAPWEPNPAGRNMRSVWTIATQPYAEAHFATFPQALVERVLAVACPEGGTVLDPFSGSGTTAYVARRMGRRAVGIDLNPEYLAMAARRLRQLSLFAELDDGGRR